MSAIERYAERLTESTADIDARLQRLSAMFAADNAERRARHERFMAALDGLIQTTRDNAGSSVGEDVFGDDRS